MSRAPARLVDRPVARVVDRPVARVVDRPVARVVDRFVARVAQRLPPGTEQVLLQLRSLAAGSPTIGLPPARRALVLAPHPDDETLACGGTVAALVASGCDVRVVVVTDGDAAKVDLAPDELRLRRRAEASSACDALGPGPPIFLGFPDGDVAAQVTPLAREIAAQLTSFAPDVVLLPWFGDDHPDHVAVNHALVDAATTVEPLVLAGETWTPAPITRLVDVTAHGTALRAAVAAHVTASASFDLEAMLGLKRYRTVHGLRGRGLAEGFLGASLPDYRTLVEEARRRR